MPTREWPGDRGRRRSEASARRLASDIRTARVNAGLSLRAVGEASRVDHTQIWRFERGLPMGLSVADLGAVAQVVGLDLAVRAYPAGDAIRDRAQLALLERLRVQLHPRLRWQTEVPLPLPGDRRAWDAEIHGSVPSGWRTRVEAETAIADGQALERKLALKLRDDPDGSLILLVADTRANRRALAILTPGIRAIVPLDTRPLMRALRAGTAPPGNGIVVA